MVLEIAGFSPAAHIRMLHFSFTLVERPARKESFPWDFIGTKLIELGNNFHSQANTDSHTQANTQACNRVQEELTGAEDIGLSSMASSAVGALACKSRRAGSPPTSANLPVQQQSGM